MTRRWRVEDMTACLTAFTYLDTPQGCSTIRLVVQGLISTVWVDNGQALVGNNCGSLAHRTFFAKTWRSK